MSETRLELADWALTAEIDAHILVEEEDSVREDWWRASCGLHNWYTTGRKPIVEDAAAEHVASEHPPCGALPPTGAADSLLRCYLQPGHDGDHMGRGSIWLQEVPAWPARKPRIQRCRPWPSGCHGRHGGPWMLFTDREDAFMPCATWDEALAKLASWYEERR